MQSDENLYSAETTPNTHGRKKEQVLRGKRKKVHFQLAYMGKRVPLVTNAEKIIRSIKLPTNSTSSGSKFIKRRSEEHIINSTSPSIPCKNHALLTYQEDSFPFHLLFVTNISKIKSN